jgi:hypothetical protein
VPRAGPRQLGPRSHAARTVSNDSSVHRNRILHRGRCRGRSPHRDLRAQHWLSARFANGTLKLPPGAPEPLALFRAAARRLFVARLYQYTGIDPEHFQNFVIFTNYQFYVVGRARLRGGDRVVEILERRRGLEPQCAVSWRERGQC